jgi:hypothetical protein
VIELTTIHAIPAVDNGTKGSASAGTAPDSNNLTPNPFPSGKGNRIQKGRGTGFILT